MRYFALVVVDRKGHKCFECKLKKHPDFNTEKGLSWSESKKGKEWKAKGKVVQFAEW